MNSYRDVVGALDSWRVQLELHQSAADKSLSNAKTAASDLAAGRDEAAAAKKSFTLADEALTEALDKLEKWEDKTPPANVTLPTDRDISRLRSTRTTRRTTLDAATGDVDDAKARLDSATRLVAEAKADYDTAAKQVATTIRAARAKAIPKDSIWKKITGSKAWQILITIVTVVLVVALVLALVLTGAGAAIAVAVLAVAGAILTADDVAQFMAGNMSGAEFAIAMALNFIPGGKAGKAIVNGLKRVVAPLAKVAGALGDLKKITGPAMAKLAAGIRKAGEALDSHFEKVFRNLADDAGDLRLPFGRADDAADAARKGADDAVAEGLRRRDEEIASRIGLPDDVIDGLRSRYLDGPGAPRVNDDGRIDVPGAEGRSISVEDYVRVRHASTWNDDAAVTVLGSWEDGPGSYLHVAEKAGARHFNLGATSWSEQQKRLGLDNDQMYELFNKPFLEETIARGNPVRFSHDPRNIDPTRALAKEKGLLENAGYELHEEADGLWMKRP